ncbi:MAG: hypothetical protein MJ010_06890 [Paludibacteraceae bacterium]|nr:hypothetical protein [Paludibacteraceae bacterium]
MEIKNENFKALIQSCKEGDYIGQGNPDSKILIIGKEHSINNEKQKQLEIGNNWKQWQNDELENGYHPRYCYKHITTRFGEGQRFLIAPKSGGTSATWYAYQKLINTIYPDIAVKKNEVLNFFDHCFITELSAVSRSNNNKLEDDDIKATAKSIKERTSLLSSAFYRSFPVVILFCGHYPKQYDINIEEMFDVKWESPTKDFELANKKGWYNIHYSEDKQRIVIHTWQASAFVKNKEEHVQDFFNKIIVKLCKSRCQ